MQHKKNDHYLKKLKKHVNDNFQNDISRTTFLNNFDSWPSAKNETWKLSRLGRLSRKEICPLVFSSKENLNFKKVLDDCYTLIFNNGLFIENLSDKLPESIEISLLKIDDLKTFLSSVENFDICSHPTLNISGACSKDIVKIKIKNNSKIKKPIQIIQSGGEKNDSIHPLIFFEIEEHVSVSFLEVFNSGSGLITPLELFKIKKSSKLDFVKIFEDEPETHNLSLSIKIIEEDAFCNCFSLIKGGEFTRFETHAFLRGKNSKFDFNGIYLTSNNNHHDFTSVIYHEVPNCNSSQKVRGVLADKSTGVFQGKVIVKKNAQKTNAQQMSKAILLSDQANSNSKPELEIYADDVICSHGATVGELDENQIFYLISRGISKQKACLILTQAFFSELIEDSVDKLFLETIHSKTKLELNRMLNVNYD